MIKDIKFSTVFEKEYCTVITHDGTAVTFQEMSPTEVAKWEEKKAKRKALENGKNSSTDSQ